MTSTAPPAGARRTHRWANAIANGGRRRCPRCGQGALFERWNRVRPRCESCGLRYLLNQGDPWVFLLVLDRGVFILPPIAIIYFGLLPQSIPGIAIVFGVLVGALIYTTPHRYGVCVALDWLTRGNDEADAIGYPSDRSLDPTREPTERNHDLG